jgi:hypothetical protein
LAPERKPYLLRLDPQVLRALQKWAQDDLRSLNAQIDFLLRAALVRAARMKDPNASGGGSFGGAAPPSNPGPGPPAS